MFNKKVKKIITSIILGAILVLPFSAVITSTNAAEAKATITYTENHKPGSNNPIQKGTRRQKLHDAQNNVGNSKEETFFKNFNGEDIN